MQVGDTRFDPEGRCATGQGKYVCNMYMAAVMFGRRHGWKFKGRKAEGGGVIVERIA